MAPALEPVFTIRGVFARENMIDVKTVKGGPSRMVVPFKRGWLRSVDGRLDAEMLPSGGADWLLIDPEGTVCHIDVRLSFRTADDQSFYTHYPGILQVDEKSHGPLGWKKDGARSTAFGDHEWFVSPVMETSDPDWKWVEGAVFVGQGRWVCEDGEVGVEYEVCRVRPGKAS